MTCSEAEKKNKVAIAQADMLSAACAFACMAFFIMLGMNSKAPNGTASGAAMFMFCFALCCCCSMMSAMSDFIRVSGC